MHTACPSGHTRRRPQQNGSKGLRVYFCGVLNNHQTQMPYRRFWKGLHIADKRGITGFRSMRDSDGSTVRLAITQKPGPKGGHTVAIGRYRPSGRKGSR